MSWAMTARKRRFSAVKGVGKMNVPRWLIDRAIDGDESAQEKILAIAEEFVRPFIRTHIEDRNDAEDVIQECLIDIWRSLRNGKPQGNFEDWCAKLAWKRIDKYRERGWDGSEATNREIVFSNYFAPDTDSEFIEGEVARRGIW